MKEDKGCDVTEINPVAFYPSEKLLGLDKQHLSPISIAILLHYRFFSSVTHHFQSDFMRIKSQILRVNGVILLLPTPVNSRFELT